MAKSEEVEEKKELIKLEKELIKLKKSAELEKHKLRMTELEYSRENNRLFHERELERGRIKWAEIKKTQQRKADIDFMRGQGRPHG